VLVSHSLSKPLSSPVVLLVTVSFFLFLSLFLSAILI
jgi:hypothetical protein